MELGEGSLIVNGQNSWLNFDLRRWLGVLERKSSFFATLRSDRANGLTEHESVYVAENHQFENVFNS